MRVVLGIGTNLGDRLQHLRDAITRLRQCNIIIEAISPIYTSDALLPDNAPPDWNLAYLNIAIRCQTSLEPLELLNVIQMIEQQSGRPDKHAHWGPRIIDIDILAWENQAIDFPQLTVPHKQLLHRPFALWPLADVAPFWILPGQDKTAAELVEKWDARLSGDAPFHTRQLAQRLEGSKLVGILNVTPDSFSHDGHRDNPEAALTKALQLIHDGAEVIDIGAESSSPKATAITWEQEWQRLEPVLDLIQQSKHKFVIAPCISVDTYHPETAQRALQYRVDWINDISGGENPRMREVVLDSDAKFIFMHHVGIPARGNYVPRQLDAVAFILEWAHKRLEELIAFGFDRSRLLFDPGIGFGKKPEQSLEIMKRIRVFQELQVPLFVGHSRKTLSPVLLNMPVNDRDIETTTVSLYLANQDVDFLRVHNVAMHGKALKMMDILRDDLC